MTCQGYYTVISLSRNIRPHNGFRCGRTCSGNVTFFTRHIVCVWIVPNPSTVLTFKTAGYIIPQEAGKHALTQHWPQVKASPYPRLLET